MDCVGVLFIGVCRVLGRLLSVAGGMYRYVFMGLWWVLVRLLSVAGGMYRYVCYGCVPVAWEIAVGSLWNASVACVIVWLCFLIVSFSGCCLIVGSLWNVSVCFLSVCVGRLGDRAYCFLHGTLFII